MRPSSNRGVFDIALYDVFAAAADHHVEMGFSQITVELLEFVKLPPELNPLAARGIGRFEDPQIVPGIPRRQLVKERPAVVVAEAIGVLVKLAQ